MPRKKKEEIQEEVVTPVVEQEEAIEIETKPKRGRKAKVIDTDTLPVEDDKPLVDNAVTNDGEENKKSILEGIKEEELNASKEKQLIASKAKTEKRIQKMLKKNKSREKINRINADVNSGLSEEEINERLVKGYVNVRNKNNTKSIKKIIFTNIFTFFNILMLLIAAWLISVGAIKDLFFLVIVTLNVIIGIVQEIRAKMTIDKLSIISSPTAKVIRDGTMQEIGVEDIVIDDIIIYESGKQISSDSIVADGVIEVNESLLTGESDAILKRPGDTLYSGSFVVSGNCKARVDAVGEDNYIEKLTKEAKRYSKPKSELLQSLNIIIRFMAVIIIPIGAILFCMQFEQLLGAMNLTDATRKTAGAMIGMIPSGLYLLTSIALAVGVMRLAQNNVLVQELYCIEMLARVDCLCLDKTGTITDGTMSVKNVIEYQGLSGLSIKNIVSAILNAHDADNMTNRALEEKFGRAKRMKHLNLIPFSSQRKFSAVTFDKVGTFVMGAPEFVLTKNYKLVAQDVNDGAKQGYRVLVIAHTDEPIKNGKVDHDNLQPIALIYIEDTIRPDAIETINYFKQSGVEVKVISGDNPLTVSRISERAGIENATEYISLEGLTDVEVIHAATKYTVFGRVSPIQKKLLVTTLKEAGKTVAMTGDGVNDILALKEADCSISVASGSEAARNVSHLVLLDNNFGSMPKVVSEGRRVINNVSKVSKLFLTKTIFSLLLAIYAINAGGSYPISTNQLFLIDTFCIGIPSFFLVLEPNNAKFEGGFLKSVIKGALPGAIVILINAMIVLGLSTALGLNKRDTSTLIVIIATFTCLTVLFQTCAPWKLYKKFLYAVLFSLCVFISVVLPSFLDFTPVSTVGRYYDSNLEVVSVNYWPHVIRSEAQHLVINDLYTEYTETNITKLANDGGMLKVGSTTTTYSLDIVTTKKLDYNGGSYNTSNTMALGGIKTTSQYTADIDIQISYYGVVYVNGLNVDFSVLPTVTLSKMNTFVIDGVDTGIESNESDVRNVYLQGYKLYVNDNDINYTLKPVTLSVDNDGYVYVGAQTTPYEYNDENISKISVASDLYYTYDGSNIVFDSKELEYDIDVMLSEKDHYVIDTQYTSYVAKKTDDVNMTFEIDADTNELIIDNVKTNYIITTVTSYGGQVNSLGLSAILLMVALCAITAPLMKFLKRIVPWIKQLIDNITRVVSKL